MFLFSENSHGNQRFRSRSLRGPGTVLLLFFPFLPTLLGCDDSVARVESQLGGIEVTTVTESPSVLPDSFTVLLNGAVAGRVGRNDTYVIPYLPAGDYLVELEDEWKGCWFGCNLRPVTVEAKNNIPITFLIRCKDEPSLPEGKS